MPLEVPLSARTTTGNQGNPIHFLANKVDLKDRITFDKSELAEVAAAYDSPYDYTDARTGDNVQEAFDNLAKMIVG